VGSEPPFNSTEFFERRKREDAEHLAKVIEQSHTRGKEPFDMARLRQLANNAPCVPPSREEGLRADYYVFKTEIMTLKEYAEHLIEMMPWEDAR
jgi:hypothetical protein